MNKYYCVVCDTESVINSIRPEIASCTCTTCKKQTVHRWTRLKGKETPKEGTQAVQNIIPPSVPLQPPPKPTVQLDVSTGAVQVETPQPANQTADAVLASLQAKK